MSVAVLFVLFLGLAFLGVPIGFAIGIGVLGSVFTSNIISLSYFVRAMANSVDSFTLTAVPFFVLAGQIMSEAGGTHCHGRLLRPDDSSQHGTGCIREPEQCVYLQAVYGRDSAGIIHWLLFPGILPYLRQKA